MDIAEFRRVVYENYGRAGRVLPWRENTEAWGVLLSEFMLQQTQIERVKPYWFRWMEMWPRPEDVHRATLEEALREWSGLGYNRRGVYLKNCAGIITESCRGRVPDTPGALQSLPGIGPYTAGSIACFAYNYPAVFIETNIRAALLHVFFGEKEGVRDGELLPILEKALDRANPRKWYWALMDYGAALKKLTANPGRRSAHHVKQGPFQGSFRQIRGGVIRALVSRGPGTVEDILKSLDLEMEVPAGELYRALEALEKDAMVAEKNGVYRVR
jgi:A/G-specific adenine glycosylase